VRVLGIASSSRMLLSEEGIDLSKWRDDFSQCAVGRSRASTWQWTVSSQPAVEQSKHRAVAPPEQQCFPFGCVPSTSFRMRRWSPTDTA